MKYGVGSITLDVTSLYIMINTCDIYGMTVSERMYCSSPEANRAELYFLSCSHAVVVLLRFVAGLMPPIPSISS